MTKQDLAEVVGYIKDMEFAHNCEMEGQKATLNHCSRKDYEDKQALQKELAEVKSKLDEAKAEINKANARGLPYFSCGECGCVLTNEATADAVLVRHPQNECPQSGKYFEQPEVELKEAKR